MSTQTPQQSRMYTNLVLLAILGVALTLRLWNLSGWSLWEDEETTIYFSQHLGKPFPVSFPVFFSMLGGLFHLTGISVSVGRMLSTAAGLMSIWLTYALVRRYTSDAVAAVAALLVAVNLGHVFWSQSIRYYTTVLVFQILCVYGFLEGFERGKYQALLWSNLAFVAALLTHFSAVLLAPVLIGYLALMMLRKESVGGYGLRGYLVFGLPFVAILVIFAGYLIHMHGMIGGWVITSARQPLHILKTVVAYFGAPVLALGLLAPAVASRVPKRLALFCWAASVIPILELVVLARLNLVNVTWYYALFALIGFVTLAASSLVSMFEGERRWRPAALAALTGLYYLASLVGYHTTMHGDRPRWEEATAFVKQAAAVEANGEGNPAIFAMVSGVVAYYLGVEPAQTMGNSLVSNLPSQPPSQETAIDQWYLVKASHISEAYAAWFATHCELKKTFEAHTGPVDRSIRVYFRPGAS